MATAIKAAKHIFISPSRFRDLLDAEIITRMPAGKYVLDKVREEYILNAQKVMAGRAGEGGAALSTQRARLATAQSERAEFQNAISRGDYVKLSVMKDGLIALFSVMRERTLTLPGKIADALQPFTPKDRAEIHDILRDECHALLEDLSQGKVLPSARKKGEEAAE
jgi:hypothetical protein